MSATLAAAFRTIVESRHSHRVFDSAAAFDEGAVARSLSLATLAANSSNLQLWEFYRVRSHAKHKLLADACLGQKAARSSREMVVFVTRRDHWRPRAKLMAARLRRDFAAELGPEQQRIINYYEKLMPFVYTSDPFGLLGCCKHLLVNAIGLFKPMFRQVRDRDLDVVVHKSCALAAQTFMLGIKAEGYDTCPMEGFDSRMVKRLLALPRSAQINMVVAVGPVAVTLPPAQRIRVDEREVIFTI